MIKYAVVFHYPDIPPSPEALWYAIVFKCAIAISFMPHLCPTTENILAPPLHVCMCLLRDVRISYWNSFSSVTIVAEIFQKPQACKPVQQNKNSTQWVYSLWYSSNCIDVLPLWFNCTRYECTVIQRRLYMCSTVIVYNQPCTVSRATRRDIYS